MTTPSVPPIALAGEPDLIKRICDAIRAADNKSVDEALYMLDSDDCIKIIETFAAPTPSASSVPVATPVMWFVSSDPDADGWVVFKEREAEDCKQDGCDVTPLYAATPANPAPSAPHPDEIMHLGLKCMGHWTSETREFSRQLIALLQANGATK